MNTVEVLRYIKGCVVTKVISSTITARELEKAIDQAIEALDSPYEAGKPILVLSHDWIDVIYVAPYKDGKSVWVEWDYGHGVRTARVFGTHKPIPKERLECEWVNCHGEYWETTCGNAHCFIDDGPNENLHKFCPYCGGKLKTITSGSMEGKGCDTCNDNGEIYTGETSGLNDDGDAPITERCPDCNP